MNEPSQNATCDPLEVKLTWTENGEFGEGLAPWRYRNLDNYYPCQYNSDGRLMAHDIIDHWMTGRVPNEILIEDELKAVGTLIWVRGDTGDLVTAHSTLENTLSHDIWNTVSDGLHLDDCGWMPPIDDPGETDWDSTIMDALIRAIGYFRDEYSISMRPEISWRQVYYYLKLGVIQAEQHYAPHSPSWIYESFLGVARVIGELLQGAEYFVGQEWQLNIDFNSAKVHLVEVPDPYAEELY